MPFGRGVGGEGCAPPTLPAPTPGHPDRAGESDKAWDAMHRALSDGELTWDGGEYPINDVVLGGKLLYTGDDFILVLNTPEQARDVAAVLPDITEAEFRRRYFAIDPKS